MLGKRFWDCQRCFQRAFARAAAPVLFSVACPLGCESVSIRPIEATTPVVLENAQEPEPLVKDAGISSAAPAVPPRRAEYTLNLETALGLACIENPTIALAEEAVRASMAEQLQARALLFPTLT